MRSVVLLVMAVTSATVGTNVLEKGRVSPADAPLKEAKKVAVLIERQQAAFATGSSAMAEAGAKSTPILLEVIKSATETEKLKGLRPAISELRTLNAMILQRRDSLQRSYLVLRESLSTAPAAFQKAGQTFRQYAAAEEFDGHRADYIVLAEIWERLAALSVARQGEVDANATEINDFLRYVESTDRYLQRLELHLDAVPDLAGAASWKADLVALQEYINRYEALRANLRNVHRRLWDDKPSMPDAPEQTSTPEQSTAPEPSGAPEQATIQQQAVAN
jgi:hypothetical protein